MISINYCLTSAAPFPSHPSAQGEILYFSRGIQGHSKNRIPILENSYKLHIIQEGFWTNW